MSANMGRDLGELFLIDAVILLADMFKVFFPMQSYHRHSVLVQIKKAAFALNVRFYHRRWTAFKDPFETGVNIIGHGNFSRAVSRFRWLNHILHVPLALKLMVNVYHPILQINIRYRQPDKFRDTHSCFEEDINTVVVFAEMLVPLDEVQESTLLLPCDSLSRYDVIDNHCCKLEIKRILANQIIFDGHFKRRSYYAAHRMNGAVPSPVLLKLDKPETRITFFDLINPLCTEILFFKNVQHEIVIRFRVVVIARLNDLEAATLLIDVIAPQIKRDSGYLRIERAGFRRGDNAEMGTISFVDEIDFEAEVKSDDKKAASKSKTNAKEDK